MINRHLAIYNYKGSNKYESLDVFNFKLNSLFVDFKYRPITIKFIVEEEESNFTLDELFFDGNWLTKGCNNGDIYITREMYNGRKTKDLVIRNLFINENKINIDESLNSNVLHVIDGLEFEFVKMYFDFKSDYFNCVELKDNILEQAKNTFLVAIAKPSDSKMFLEITGKDTDINFILPKDSFYLKLTNYKGKDITQINNLIMHFNV